MHVYKLVLQIFHVWLADRKNRWRQKRQKKWDEHVVGDVPAGRMLLLGHKVPEKVRLVCDFLVLSVARMLFKVPIILYCAGI